MKISEISNMKVLIWELFNITYRKFSLTHSLEPLVNSMAILKIS